MGVSRPRADVTLGSATVLLIACLASLGLATACAKTKPPGAGSKADGGVNADGGGVAGTTGSGGIGGSGSGGNAGGNTGTGGGITQDPPPGDCMPDGTCPAGFLCTSSNKCGKIGTPCQNPNDCQGDTFCCTGACRKDAMNTGVCLPGNVPPGIACKGPTAIGVFSPQVQCEWTDATSSYVASSPVVADLPNDPNSAEIVFVSFGTGSADNGATTGVLRIISGNDCKLLETISTPLVRANTTPALADLDGDGTVEIVALQPDGKPIAFKWNGTRYAMMWAATTGPMALMTQMWSGVSIHNLDEDNIPEVLVGSTTAGAVHTYNGMTGVQYGIGIGIGTIFNGLIPIVADLDGDKVPELLLQQGETIFVSKWLGTAWEPTQHGRVDQQIAVLPATQFAVADFGTAPLVAGGAFDATKLDGIPEIVAVSETNGTVAVFTRAGQVVMRVMHTVDMGVTAISEGGGPPVIGDFDNDGLPEFGIAGASRFRVYDLGCTAAGNGCEAPFIRWSRQSQDASSRQTGASVFDFDGDGKSEVVYADECFLRIYAGSTGEVLYSTPRTSGTWYENPVIADVDRDDRAEIVVNSAYHAACPTKGTPGTPYVDPIHPGVRCLKAEDCVLGTTCGGGFCRCTGNNQCDMGLSCQAPLAGTMGTGNVCRSTHPNAIQNPMMPTKGGIRVVNDRLDRWASSLPIWNQHAYSITNVKVNGQIPKASEWLPNWKEMKPGYNSFRQNAQGTANVEDLADVTGKLDIVRACRVKGAKVTLTGRVCNRGSRAVGSKLPATFYDKDGKILCVSFTAEPVQSNNDCKAVSCEVDQDTVQGTVKMVVNDDGKGGRTTVECRAENNTDQIELKLSDCVVE